MHCRWFVVASLLLGAAMQARAGDTGGGLWLSAGQDLGNTRNQGAERALSVGTVGGLQVRWAFTTAGDVSATPAVDGARVYFPDWAGWLYALDRRTGRELWRASIAQASGVPGDKARASPLVAGGKVIVGTQGPFGGGGKLLAFDKDSGALVWATVVEAHPAAIITQSASAFDGRVYVGVASMEEALAVIPGYPCCSFRGSAAAVDLETGTLLWKTYMIPAGYSGGAVWGSAPAVDVRRGQVYIATGNNYSLPDPVQACVAANPSNPSGCIAADDLFDSVVALDLGTGAVRWATRAIPFDAWTGDCLPFFGDGTNCPQPAGPDYDFGQAPALFTTQRGAQIVGAGQKSGQYWAMSPDTGQVLWVTQAGPGGTAGGLQWGSAVDGRRVYTANANSNFVPWTLPGGAIVTSGVWSGLDAATGALLWQTTPPFGGGTSGPVTTANGVVFGCSLDALGHMYALDGATGRILWSFASGGSCLSGAAISNGDLFWGSGYSNFGFGTPNNKLYAFTVR
ncbi:MAG: PQQ-binding-like beta-propeller repeat protein [Anaeromyxobacter sp.]